MLSFQRSFTLRREGVPWALNLRLFPTAVVQLTECLWSMAAIEGFTSEPDTPWASTWVPSDALVYCSVVCAHLRTNGYLQ